VSETRGARARRLTLLGLAVLGGALLVFIAVTRWTVPSDEFAYWLGARRLIAGEPLYAPLAAVGTPYAYWYPPPLAQVLAPLTLVLPDGVFVAAWTALLLFSLWWLGLKRLLVGLALVCFLPVAIELWFRNVHLVLAVLAVLALRRSALFWIPAAAIKITPVIGLFYLVAGRRYREAIIVGVAGLLVLLVSVALSPDAWSLFIEFALRQGGGSGASLVPVPFPARLAAAIILALVAGRLGGRNGEMLLIIALVVGNPTLWTTAFAMLVAIVPLWFTSPKAVSVQTVR
jgi:hypothetical protein